MIWGAVVFGLLLVLILRRRGRKKRATAATDGLTELLAQRPERRGRYDYGPFKGRSL